MRVKKLYKIPIAVFHLIGDLMLSSCECEPYELLPEVEFLPSPLDMQYLKW